MISPKSTVQINLRDYRQDASQRIWELPQWGHPASLMVMPLFIAAEGRLTPIGTAFTVGAGLGFVMSATHNIFEAIKLDGLHDRQVATGMLPQTMALRHVGLSVLHFVESGEGRVRISFLPIGSIEGAPPTDVVIGFAQLPLGTPSISLPLSFAIPDRGDVVWSLGYSDFIYPEGGIPIDAVRDGSFDWESEYSHRFLVVEAEVEAAFSARLKAGFVDGPCFAFNETIPHGLSGGPVISEDGRVIGVNSAGAEMFFGRPMSIATMLYPLALTPVRYGATIGPITMNARRRLIELMSGGVIRSDGSEDRIAFMVDEDGTTSIMAGVPKGTVRVFEDLDGYMSDVPARTLDGEMYVFKRKRAPTDGGEVRPSVPNLPPQ